MADAFYYVDGDRTKTHVDLAVQPAGTHMVLVTPGGRDVHFVVGKTKNNDMAVIVDRFAKSHAHTNQEG